MTQKDSKKWYKFFMVVDNFLQNLRILMEVNGELTQHKLADISGIPRGRIGSWISRRTIPGPDDLELLSKAFNVEPYYFFMKPGTQGEAKPTERDDDFKSFMDELAQKLLSEHDLKSYHHFGGHRTVLKVMRENYETNDLKTTDWTRILIAEIGRYSTVDLMEKLRKRQEATALPAKKSDSA